MTDLIQHLPNHDFNYPKEMVWGSETIARFYDYSNHVNYFAEVVDRSVVRDHTIELGIDASYQLLTAVIPKGQRLVIEVYSKGQGNADWQPFLREVLYTDESARQFYRVYEV